MMMRERWISQSNMTAPSGVQGNESNQPNHKHTMPNDNRISAIISDEVKAQILVKL